MTQVTKLYKSRKYDHSDDNYRVYYSGPLVDLVQTIEQECYNRQLTLSRWETSSRQSSWVKTITWAIHTGERPARSDLLPGGSMIIKLSQVEGSTEKCIAYRELSAMLERLVS